MRAMILAAGRGERMRPLTDHCPKPLLKVAGKPLLVYHIEKLVAMGIEQIVINHAWLGEKIEQTIGDGAQWGIEICYSAECAGGLETAGGIIQALPLLGDEPFLVINGDIWTDFDFSHLLPDLVLNSPECLAHLVLVDNPAHHPEGDFGLQTTAPYWMLNDAQLRYTFSGIGLYRSEFFIGLAKGRLPLAPILREKIAQQQITAEHYAGQWTDVGTPERLAKLEQELEQTLVSKNNE